MPAIVVVVVLPLLEIIAAGASAGLCPSAWGDVRRGKLTFLHDVWVPLYSGNEQGDGVKNGKLHLWFDK